MDQLALGQLCASEEGAEASFDCEGGESESWTMAEAMSTDMEPWFGGAAAAAAGGSSGSCSVQDVAAAAAAEKALLHAHQHQQQQHAAQQHLLQPVQEVVEDACC